jgi:2-methylcitrate dehydratase
MENVLFKISYPAEFHAQTAVEAAIRLHPQVRDRLNDVKKIVITTHESALRIIDKKGPLHNPADRDHCIQYMSAIGLIKGSLTAADYEDAVANDPLVDWLRSKMACVENRQWSRDYLDPAKRSIANALQVFFNDGTKTDRITVEYPLGHRRRRKEGVPQLEAKFRTNLARRFAPKQQQAILAVTRKQERLEATPVNEFVDRFAT